MWDTVAHRGVGLGASVTESAAGIGTPYPARTVTSMTTDLPDQNPAAPDDIEALLNELQTYGDIEARLRAGLSVDQVVSLMIFRAMLIDLLFRGITAPEPESGHAADALREFFQDLEIDMLASGQDNLDPERYGSPAELLAACKSVVETLQNTEPPEPLDDPVSHASFMAIYALARHTLPTAILVSEVALQIADLQAGAGIWRHSE